MSIQNLTEMTVLELRKLAKENKVKLSAGLSKAGIIEKIEAVLPPIGDAQPVPAQAAPQVVAAESVPQKEEATPPPAKPQEPKQKPALEKADEAQAPAQPQFKAAWRNPRTEPQYRSKPSYQAPAYSSKPAWQARPTQQRPISTMRQEMPRTIAPQRPAGYTPRFGPTAEDTTQPQAAEQARPFGERTYGDRPSYRGQEPLRNDDFRAPDTFRQDAQRQPAMRTNPFENTPQEPFGEANRTPYRAKQQGPFNQDLGATNPAVPEMLAAGDCGDGEGLLEIHPDGYGFLRPNNFLPGSKDIYVSMAQIRRFALRTGDYIVGKTRPQREGDKYSALLYITKVNDQAPEELTGRPAFEDLTPIYPQTRIVLAQDEKNLSLRLIDLIAPMGLGQRGLIVAPGNSGKTALLKDLCNAIHQGHPDAHIMTLLLDERPEDITDFKDNAPCCELLAAPFDQSPENQIRIAEMVTERAQRLVEQKKDVVVLVDSLTRLARAYNTVSAQSSRTPQGIMNPAVVYKAKKLFASARNLREGGSLTVIATLYTDTGVRMDDALLEEFKGTATMELYLDKELVDKKVYPPINLQKSGTRRDDLLLTPQQAEGLESIRTVLCSGSNKDALLQLLDMLGKTSNNEDFLTKIKDWIALWKKNGFVLQR